MISFNGQNFHVVTLTTQSRRLTNNNATTAVSLPYLYTYTAASVYAVTPAAWELAGGAAISVAGRQLIDLDGVQCMWVELNATDSCRLATGRSNPMASVTHLSHKIVSGVLVTNTVSCAAPSWGHTAWHLARHLNPDIGGKTACCCHITG